MVTTRLLYRVVRPSFWLSVHGTRYCCSWVSKFMVVRRTTASVFLVVQRLSWLYTGAQTTKILNADHNPYYCLSYTNSLLLLSNSLIHFIECTKQHHDLIRLRILVQILSLKSIKKLMKIKPLYTIRRAK